MLVLKEVSAKSPPDSPSPVKSRRSTATPASARVREMRAAAMVSFEQVKQCANIAYARTWPSGTSSMPTSSSPVDPVSVIRRLTVISGRSPLRSGAPVSPARSGPRCDAAPMARSSAADAGGMYRTIPVGVLVQVLLMHRLGVVEPSRTGGVQVDDLGGGLAESG